MPLTVLFLYSQLTPWEYRQMHLLCQAGKNSGRCQRQLLLIQIDKIRFPGYSTKFTNHNTEMAAKRRKKHKNKISRLVISMSYNEKKSKPRDGKLMTGRHKKQQEYCFVVNHQEGATPDQPYLV